MRASARHIIHENAVLDCRRCEEVVDTAAAADADAATPVSADGLVAEERAVRDGGGRACHQGADGAARRRATAWSAQALITDERATVDRETARQVEDARGEPSATRATERSVAGEEAVHDRERPA